MAVSGRAGIWAVSVMLLLASSLPAALPAASPGGPGGAPPAGGGAGPRAAERPDHTGPYPNAGYMYAQFKGSTRSYFLNLKIWYPARSAAENATPDNDGAPYPVIVQLPFFGGPEGAYDGIAPQVVSWGFISVCVGPNWTDFVNNGNINPDETDLNEMLDMLEGWNATPGHKLYRMVDRNFGISGYSSGGGIAVYDAALVGRIRALQAMAPAISDDTLDALAPYMNKPFQFQAGQNDSMYRPHSVHGFSLFPPPKAFLDTKDGSHGGPFFWDCMISFFMFYLKGLPGYETYLYGWGAMDDLSVPKYYLNFQLPNGTFFPGGLQVQGLPLAVNLSEPVSFHAFYDGYLPLGHPNGSFQWDFESDGVIDSSDPLNATAVHGYDRSGYLHVDMWYAIGEYRLRANNSLYITVRNQPPTVALHDGYSVPEDGLLQVRAEATDTPGDNESLRFTWQFGDGKAQGPSDQRTVLHSYSRAGNYTLQVTVADPAGATAAASAKVVVADVPPTVEVGPDIAVGKDAPAEFLGSGGGTPSDFPSLLFSWDFGDGNSSGWTSGPNATHTYTRSGNLTALLSVKDDEGSIAQGRVRVAVSNAPPVARIVDPADNASLDKDREIRFEGLAGDTESDAPLLQFRWDFGDGPPTAWSASPDATHSYALSGNYTVRFQSRDSEGATGESSLRLTVRNQPPEVRLLSPWTAEADEDAPLEFAAEGDDTASDIGLLNYTWDIDGRTFYGASVNLSFSTEGVKEYRVTVRDPEGAEASASHSLLVNNPAPRLGASLSPLRLTVNHTVNFSATASDTPSDLPALSVQWDFGDGGGSADFNGTHYYAAPGTYEVKVTVTDDENAGAGQDFTVVVDPARPQPQPPLPANRTGEGQKGPPLAMAAGLSAVAIIMAAVAASFLLRRRKGPPPPDRPR